jgi:hypothetical protein
MATPVSSNPMAIQDSLESMAKELPAAEVVGGRDEDKSGHDETEVFFDLFTQNQLLVGSVGDSVYVRELAVYD